MLRIGLNFKINTYLYVLFPWLCKQLKCVLKDTDKPSLDVNTLTFQAFLRCLWCPGLLLQSLQEIHKTKDTVPIARASHWHEKENWKGNCNTGQNEARSTWSHRKLWKHLEGFIYKGGSVGQSLENENGLRRREPGWGWGGIFQPKQHSECDDRGNIFIYEKHSIQTKAKPPALCTRNAWHFTVAASNAFPVLLLPLDVPCWLKSLTKESELCA